MDAQSDAVETTKATEAPFDFEATFRAQYARIAGVIARVVRDPARAEDLAVDVFLKFWRTPQAHSEKAGGWLYRVAVRKGLDELRRRTRRTRYEHLL
jgi:RNA polymerase sigma-70 factor, ECF subfamily